MRVLHSVCVLLLLQVSWSNPRVVEALLNERQKPSALGAASGGGGGEEGGGGRARRDSSDAPVSLNKDALGK